MDATYAGSMSVAPIVFVVLYLLVVKLVTVFWLKTFRTLKSNARE